MEATINFSELDWTEEADFLFFAFGDFNSSEYNIVRTSTGSRYEKGLAPPIKDLTIDVPGGDGQYFFGATHAPRIFNIEFAFSGLTIDQINDLKKAFSGKELKELAFSEDCTYSTIDNSSSITDARIYIAKITGQPNIKTLAFGNGEDKIYNGEGTIQFTAYWPYARSKEKSNQNNGDIPAFFEWTGNASSVTVNGNTITAKDGASITYWNSRTGLVKNNNSPIPYEGNGIVTIPVGQTVSFSFYSWYI